jgi:hypothetical protein
LCSRIWGGSTSQRRDPRVQPGAHNEQQCGHASTLVTQLSGGLHSTIGRHIKASILGQIRQALIDEMRRVGTLSLGEAHDPLLPDRSAPHNQATVSPLLRWARLGSPLFRHDSAGSRPPLHALGDLRDSNKPPSRRDAQNRATSSSGTETYCFHFMSVRRKTSMKIYYFYFSESFHRSNYSGM